MKLDETKPYGQIWGHQCAVFEQNGFLFDGSGDPVDGNPEKVTSNIKENLSDDEAKSFLSELLNGTPMSRKKVAEVAEKAGIAWFDVEVAAGTLNVQRRKQGFGETWLLND